MAKIITIGSNIITYGGKALQIPSVDFLDWSAMNTATLETYKIASGNCLANGFCSVTFGYDTALAIYVANCYQLLDATQTEKTNICILGIRSGACWISSWGHSGTLANGERGTSSYSNTEFYYTADTSCINIAANTEGSDLASASVNVYEIPIVSYPASWE